MSKRNSLTPKASDRLIRVNRGWAVRNPGLQKGRVYRTKTAALRAFSKESHEPLSSVRSGGGRFVVGRNAFAKISAIEGLHLSAEQRRDFREFDRKGFTSEKRRRAIVAKYAGKTL